MANISDADFKKLLDDLKKIKDNVDELRTKVPTGDAADIQKQLSDLNTEYETLYNNIQSTNTLTNTQQKQLVASSNDMDASVKKVNTSISNQLSSLNSNVNGSKNMFDDFFGSIMEGLNKSKVGLVSMNEAQTNLMNTATNMGGANVSFWREYARRIRDVGVEYGLSGSRLEDFRERNLELERQFVGTGNEIDDLTTGINALYQETGQVNQLTPEFARNLGNMKNVLGLNVSEVGQFMGSFMNLNVSFQTTTKILEDLRYSAEKSALNTNAVLGTFAKNFEKLNMYSFRNGVQGMMDMVKQSYALKVNMDAVLKLSDDFTDPEKTMEFASSMQMLGGSFGQLGDFNQLMYDAAVAPEDLAKNIAKATASLGSFDRETGKFSLSFADRLQLKEASKQLNMGVDDLNKMASTAAKVSDIKVALNFKDLSEEQYQVLGAMSQFDASRGEYTVKMKDESGKDVTKSIAELSAADIEKISAVKEDQTFETLNVQKMDVPQIIATNLTVAQYSTQDLFKGLGLENEKLKEEITKITKSSVDAFHENVKLGLFKPMEDFVASKVGDQVAEVVNHIGNTFKEFAGMVKSLGTEIINSDFFKKGSGAFTEALNQQFDSGKKKEKGDVLGISKYNEGNILKGLSHAQGGIPFTVNGVPGFEAEGGEVILTKGVSQDPELLTMASRINEMAGGKKFFEDGDVIKNMNSTINSNYNTVQNKLFSDENIIKNLSSSVNNIQNTDIDRKLFESGDIVKNINSNYKSIENRLLKDGDTLNTINTSTKNIKTDSVDTKHYKDGDTLSNLNSIINSNYKTIENKLFRDGDRVDNLVSNINTNYKNIDSKLFKDGDILSNLNTNISSSSVFGDKKLYEQGDILNNINSNIKNVSSFEDKKTFKDGDALTDLSTIINSNYSNINKKLYEEGDLVQKDESYNMSNLVNNLNRSDMFNSSTSISEEFTEFNNTLSNTFQQSMTTITSAIDKLQQGGLIDKRGDVGGTTAVGVNGGVTVDGKISFDPIKITIEGVGATKEVAANQEMQDRILSMVEKKINELNLYNLTYKAKGTGGVNDGKPISSPTFS